MFHLDRRSWLAAAGSLMLTAKWPRALAASVDQPALPPLPERVLEVHDGAGLERALHEVAPGDHVLLAPGSYNGVFELTRDGVAGRPIVLRAAVPGTAELMTSLGLRGRHGWAHGLVSRAAPGIAINGGEDNFVTGCRFTLCTCVLLRNGASRNRIGWNSFEEIQTDTTDYNAIRVDLRRNEINKKTAFGNHIYRNRFTSPPLSKRIRPAMVYVGLFKMDDYPDIGTLIEDNYFDRIEWKSAIRLKSHGNLIRRNTVIGPALGSGSERCGLLAQRHGNRNRWESNWTANTRGMKIHGDDSVFVANRIAGPLAFFDLMAGASTINHEPCRRSSWIANIGPMRVGFADYHEPADAPAQHNRIERHHPPDAIALIEGLAQDTVILPRGSSQPLPARPLGFDEVGADALTKG